MSSPVMVILLLLPVSYHTDRWNAGNCLFASLADQLYGSPTRHLEVRSRVIEYMREMKEDFEHVALADDIQQKRATRRDTSVLQNINSFEGYLTVMAKNGTYGGDPELSAFVRCFDQDVMVHLPNEMKPKSLDYTNPYRAPDAVIKPMLHICYDNKIVNAHYDSARKNGSDSDGSIAKRSTRRQQVSPIDSDAALKSRAARNHRADMMKNIMLESLNEPGRPRSPSISSSQQSTSSKRSFEDDDEPHRATKRADRKPSTRNRTTPQTSSRLHSTNNKTKLTSGLATPASTQDGDYSSDQSDRSSCPDLDTVRRRPILQAKSPSRSVSPIKDDAGQTIQIPRNGSNALRPSVTLEYHAELESTRSPIDDVVVVKQDEL